MKGPDSRAVDYRWVILAVTMLAHGASGTASQGMPTLAAFYQADLQLTKAQVGLLSSAVSLGSMASLMASGWIADLVGMRRVMLVGLVSIGFALASVSVAQSFAHIWLLLLLVGVAGGIPNPAIAKTILFWFPVRDRGFAMGLQRTGLPLVGAITAATLPSVALALGWRAALVVLAVGVIVSGLVIFTLYRDSPVSQPKPVKFASRPRPGGPLQLLRNRNILLASILPVVLVGAQFCLVNYLVLYLTESLGVPVVIAGGALAVTQLGGATGRVTWGVVSDRLFRGGRRQVMLLIGAASTLLLATMGFLPAGMPLWGVTILAAGLGVLALGWHGVYTILLSELSGRELAGSAVGFGYTLLQLGSLMGPPVFGYIVDVTGGYHWSWRSLALASALGTSLMLLVKEGRKD